MTTNEMWFVIVLGLNVLIVVCYLIANALRSKAQRRSCFLKAFCMFVCPIAGPVYFLIAYLFECASQKDVHIEDVIFSKDRVVSYRAPEEEKERNVVSLADAIAVSDRENLRKLMMQVVCDDDGASLAVISKGLYADDSEISHYAATVLQEKLGVYRRYVQSAFLRLQGVRNAEARAAQAAELLDYMIPMLKRGVFGAVEQSSLVQKMDTVAETLLTTDKSRLDIYIYDDLFHIALNANEDGIAEKWCNRLVAEYPGMVNAYSCRLHLYYKQGRHEEFRETMEELKKSDVVVDAHLLEWIRLFG